MPVGDAHEGSVAAGMLRPARQRSSPFTEARRLGLPAWAAAVRLLWPTFLVALVSILYQVHVGTTTDVSWYLTLSERLLDGQTAYVDFFETNPPASILLYVPAAWFARLLGLWPEVLVKASVYLLFVVSLWLSYRIARVPLAEIGRLRPAAYAAIFLLIPGDIFGQREHFIAIALLPMLALLPRRSRNESVDVACAVAAGILAGGALALKPHYAMAILLPLPFVAWHRKHSAGALLQTLLLPELLAALSVALLYAVAVIVCYPAFVATMLPIVLDAYIKFRLSALEILQSPGFLIWAAASVLVLMLGSGESGAHRRAIVLLCALGCEAAWLIQAKSWPYQGYPAIALALSALADVCAQRTRPAPVSPRRLARLAGPVLLLALLARGLVWFYVKPTKLEPLRAAMARLQPHPRLMAVGPMIRIGHPLVRQIGGTWVGRLNSTWIYGAATILLADASAPAALRQRLAGYVAMEKDMVAADIARCRPDYVLVADDMDVDAGGRPSDRKWIASTPQLAAAFSHYHPVTEVTVYDSRIVIWERS